MATIDVSLTRPQVEIFRKQSAKFVIVTKGRRFGATHGAAINYILRLLSGEGPILWGDTIRGNIDRYFERYFLPELKKLPPELWKWNVQKAQLTVNGQFMDFRSADRPENWEGFGYKHIFLNEAGIILKDDYLYTNAILPMLMDFPDSQLIAAGVPKGKVKKDGAEHRFYTLYKQAQAGDERYSLLEYVSYDNPLLRPQDIKELELDISQMSTVMVDQEIYGKFVDAEAQNPWVLNYDKQLHLSTDAVYNVNMQVLLSVDFNVDPFGLILAHVWTDTKGQMHIYVFDEIETPGGVIVDMAKNVKSIVGKRVVSSRLTGDSNGRNKGVGEYNNSSMFTKLKKHLGIRRIDTPFKNPLHRDSRDDVAYVLAHADVKIHPKCVRLERDLRLVQSDAYGALIKRNRKDVAQQADFLDCFRYLIDTYCKKWIKAHRARYSRTE
ncbi:MAG: hypothetical protein V3U84_07250 [Thiotrichaceae bacterium]